MMMMMRSVKQISVSVSEPPCLGYRTLHCLPCHAFRHDYRGPHFNQQFQKQRSIYRVEKREKRDQSRRRRHNQFIRNPSPRRSPVHSAGQTDRETGGAAIPFRPRKNGEILNCGCISFYLSEGSRAQFDRSSPRTATVSSGLGKRVVPRLRETRPHGHRRPGCGNHAT